MKRVYRFEGIDCACCAQKLEDKIAGVEGVISASVNFSRKHQRGGGEGS